MLGTYFFDVIKNHYLDFSGRATRTQFWLFVLFYIIIAFVLMTLASISGAIGNFFNMLVWIYGLALLLPSLAIGARRLRDGGFTPWLLLLLLFPGIGWLILLILWVFPSK